MSSRRGRWRATPIASSTVAERHGLALAAMRRAAAPGWGTPRLLGPGGAPAGGPRNMRAKGGERVVHQPILGTALGTHASHVARMAARTEVTDRSGVAGTACQAPDSCGLREVQGRSSVSAISLVPDQPAGVDQPGEVDAGVGEVLAVQALATAMCLARSESVQAAKAAVLTCRSVTIWRHVLAEPGGRRSGSSCGLQQLGQGDAAVRLLPGQHDRGALASRWTSRTPVRAGSGLLERAAALQPGCIADEARLHAEPPSGRGARSRTGPAAWSGRPAPAS